ncbi:hypothetical protein GFJ39_02220 [Gluconobacter sp. AC10]|uniref:Uncharacterized protein n=1 Tax=Gluconobacter aidae TaxID=2662454 RepID=A0A7X1SN27_9PROT|nr:hypothetical protein [Gluconobacter aidae]
MGCACATPAPTEKTATVARSAFLEPKNLDIENLPGVELGPQCSQKSKGVKARKVAEEPLDR